MVSSREGRSPTKQSSASLLHWIASLRFASLAMTAPIVGCCMLALAAHSAAAQDYPSRPVHLVVAFAAGGTTDFAARLIAEKAGTLLGQGIIVDNKPGANGALAAETVARAAPDGYTLFFSTVGAIAINPNLRSSLGYDVQKDFDPVAMLVRNTILLAVPANS